MDGLSTQDELFAIRLLELARHLSPQGNRVQFVESCERGGIRAYLARFAEVWEKITDSPPREGISSDQEYSSRGTSFALQAAAFQELIGSQLTKGGVSHLWLGGLSLSHLFYQNITRREFQRLEILISPYDLWPACEVLRELGFQARDELQVGQRQALERWGDHRELFHDVSGLPLTLRWRLFSPWIGSDFLPFDDLLGRSQTLTWEGLSDWATLGAADTLVYLALLGYQDGWTEMHSLLDLALGLDRLDYTWDQAVVIAGPRAVLLERAVEIVVRLLGLPHPQKMTFHFSDNRHALDSWTSWAQVQTQPREELLSPSYWSCDPSQAVRRRLRALLTPQPEQIQDLALPPTFLFLYPLLRAVRVFFGRG